jgi:hypothetical protein
MTMRYQGSRVSMLIPGFLIVFTHNGLMLLKGMPVNSTKYLFFKYAHRPVVMSSLIAAFCQTDWPNNGGKSKRMGEDRCLYRID